MNVDTTVQEKAITFPTDARLYHKMRVALVRRAKSLGLVLRQNYRFKGKRLLAKQARQLIKLMRCPSPCTRSGIIWECQAAIEPTIGHMKSDNRMNRNYLAGQIGDKINAVLAAAGYNFRKLLRFVGVASVDGRVES